MKKETNRILKAKKAFLFAGVIGLFVALILPSWSRLRSEDKIVNAQRQAEVLGYQVFQIYREASQLQAAEPVQGRSPASVPEDFLGRRESGSIGGDPWGQPYRYKILKAERDQLKVQIWSAGPNKIFETEDHPGVAAEKYLGDDVGLVLSMSPKSATE